MQHDWFMYHLRSTYKNRLDFPFKVQNFTRFNLLETHLHLFVNTVVKPMNATKYESIPRYSWAISTHNGITDKSYHLSHLAYTN